MRAILIDLDDTLFEERQYVKSGFRAVAHSLVAHHIGFQGHDPGVLADSMLDIMGQHGRGQVFDRLFSDVGATPAPEDIAGLVTLYRNHEPGLSLYDGVSDMLSLLGRHHKLALVTNGLGIMQRQKVKALGIGPYFPVVIYCDDIAAPKPSADGLQLALEQLGCEAAEAVMVGDNPDTDGMAAQKLRIPFFRVRTQRFAAKEGPALHTADSFVDAVSALLTR